MSGIERVHAERKRQMEVEGFDPYHDDRVHPFGELRRAALCYEHAQGPDAPRPRQWPWEAQFWNPKERRRNLERAGALYLAEADKMRRQAMRIARMLDGMDDVQEARVPSCMSLWLFEPAFPGITPITVRINDRIGAFADHAASALGLESDSMGWRVIRANGVICNRDQTVKDAGLRPGEKLELIAMGSGV